MTSKIIPVIISGGASTRAFPLSRANYPKPFLTLVGNKNEGTLFYNTVKRCLLFGPSDIYTVTLQSLFDLTLHEFKNIHNDQCKKHYILENRGQDTAPAFSLSIIDAYKKNPEDILLILPSDHIIENESKYIEMVNKAKEIADRDLIVIFGIKPTSPDVSFGYIQKDDPLNNIDDVYIVGSFKEKPNKTLATEYLESGQYLWNSGIICAKAKVLYNELQIHANRLLKDTVDIYENSNKIKDKNGDIVYIDYTDNYPHKLPFDIAVLEKSNNLVVIECDRLGWSDVGNFGSVSEYHLSNGKNDNAIINRYDYQITHTLKSHNCYINNASKKKVISLIGVDNLIVVETEDTLLIMSRDNSSDVKQIVNDLRVRSPSIVDHHISMDCNYKM